MLWDRHPELPFSASVPWPVCDFKGYQDWEASIHLVDTWLVSYVGHRWKDWTWGWATFKMTQNSNVCTVNFLSERHTTLFLLKFSDFSLKP
jgi:hypothetical protein